jgi:U3 small nucleolar RNA-associated protein 7
MIALDPEFLGGFAPQNKLTEGIDPNALPFARQPRLNRLRIQSKADETEDASEGESIVERPEDTSNMKCDVIRRERHRMRGKGKSIKRCVGNCSSVTAWVYMGLFGSDTCGNKEKMSSTQKP